MKPGKRRQVLLSWYGPSSIILLFAVWAVGLILGVAIIHWALESPMNTPGPRKPGLLDTLYFSGLTCFTLGFGDISPRLPVGRMLAVLEAGIGFGFLAVVISELSRLLDQLQHAGLALHERSQVESKLVSLRRMDEPFVNALFELPRFDSTPGLQRRYDRRQLADQRLDEAHPRDRQAAAHRSR